MPREINLLPAKDAAQERFETLNRKLIFASAVILVATIVSIAAIFGYWGLILRQKNQVANDINTATAIIKTYEESEFLQRTLKTNLSRLNEIFVSQTDFEQILGQIQEVVIEGVALSDLAIAKDGKIVLTGEARTSTDLSAFLRGLVDSGKGGKYFSNVNVSTLSSDKSSTYKFSLTMTMVEKTKEEAITQ